MNINELAEKRYPAERDGLGNGYPRDEEQADFIAGAELAIGFSEWVLINTRFSLVREVPIKTLYNHVLYTTEELFQIYLNQLNNK